MKTFKLGKWYKDNHPSHSTKKELCQLISFDESMFKVTYRLGSDGPVYTSSTGYWYEYMEEVKTTTKIYLYENDQRELRIDILPEEAIDYDFNPPYEVSQELVDEYTRIMLEYYKMQNKLRAIRGE